MGIIKVNKALPRKYKGKLVSELNEEERKEYEKSERAAEFMRRRQLEGDIRRRERDRILEAKFDRVAIIIALVLGLGFVCYMQFIK